MADNDFQRTLAQRFRRHHILGFPKLHDLAAHHTGSLAPGGNAQCNQQRYGAVAHGDHNQNGHKQAGNGSDDLQNAHHDLIHNAAEVGHNAAVKTSNHHLNGGTAQRHQERDPGAYPEPGEQVTAQGVGSQPELGAHIGIFILGCGGNVVVAPDIGSDDDHDQEQEQYKQGTHGNLIFSQPPPGILPIGHRLSHQLVALGFPVLNDLKILGSEGSFRCFHYRFPP